MSARPGSRAAQGPMPLQRPPSSIRGAAGMPPTTSAGMRPPTSSLAGRNMAAAPLNTTVSLEARPVTQQGLEGMRLKTAGPGRQIADKSYFLSELRQKISELSKETKSMTEESAKLQRDTALFSTLERRYEERVSEVRLLEGQLADFNLAFDKVRTNTELADIQHQFTRLRESNEHERRRLDEVFLQRADAEQRAKQVEAETEAMHRRNEERMQALGDSHRAQYVSLQQENSRLMNEIHQKEQRAEQLDERLYMAQIELKKDGYANLQKGSKLQKQHASLSDELQRLEEETSSALSPEEMRDRLMAKVKEDTAFIDTAQRKLEQLDALVGNYADQVKQKQQQLKDGQRGSEHAQNYEKLVERDKKISEFLESFPQEKDEALRQKANLQQSIVGLMQHISKGFSVQESLQASVPSTAALGDLKDELSFKKEQMQNSEMTLAHLQKELEKRQAELDKISSLDSKISVELSSLNDKIKQMEAEMVTFANIDALTQQAAEQKKNLLMEKQKNKSKRDALQQRVALVHQKLEKQKQEIQESEVFKKLDALEQKMRAHGQNIYTVNEYVTTRERESDYETVQAKSLQLMSQINQLLVQSNS